MLRRLIGLAVVAVGLSAGRLEAQVVTSYTWTVCAQGQAPATCAGLTSVTIPAASVNCSGVTIPPPPTATQWNPTRQYFVHGDTGAACVHDVTPAMLAPLPTGTIVFAVITATWETGQVSGRSTASNPFGRAGVPGAPSGLVIRREP